MNKPRRVRGVLLFCVKFAILAPAVLWVWWAWLLPPYTWAVGQVSGSIINIVSESAVQAMRLETNEAGVLNSDTYLVFHVEGRDRIFHVADLVNSAVPFVILVLATGGLGLLRRVFVLVLGSGIFFVGQVAYIVCFFVFAEQLAESQEIGVALGQFWLTLPFVMWIVLAYWDRVMGFFDEGADAPGDAATGKAAE